MYLHNSYSRSIHNTRGEAKKSEAGLNIPFIPEPVEHAKNEIVSLYYQRCWHCCFCLVCVTRQFSFSQDLDLKIYFHYSTTLYIYTDVH